METNGVKTNAVGPGEMKVHTIKLNNPAKNNAIRHDVPNHALQVNCNVFTCVHYSDGLCEADSICVDSENQETKDKNQTLCETFRKRDCGCPV